MLTIRNGDIEEILHKKKKLLVYGAGSNLKNLLDTGHSQALEESIDRIVDKVKAGEIYRYRNYAWTIESFEQVENAANISDYILIITNEKYAEIFSWLNHVESFDGMECYLWYGFMRLHTGKLSRRPLPMSVSANHSIPKVIHYCWFGRSHLGEMEHKCIDSWKRTNPEFKIKEWNEDNYNINANRYIKEAYHAQKYGFVADYARYDILSRFGGFYFDLDVELLGSIGQLAENRGVISFESLNLINSGSIMAAEIENPFVEELKKAYQNRSFINADGSYDETPCSVIETEFFKKRGVNIDDSYQALDGFLILPHEVFAPVNQYNGALELTQNTIGIHHFACSWFSEDMRREWEDRKQLVAEINKHLLIRWEAEYGRDHK